MTTKQAIAKYGEPNVTGEGYLETLILPYPMRVAWEVLTGIMGLSIGDRQIHKTVPEYG